MNEEQPYIYIREDDPYFEGECTMEKLLRLIEDKEKEGYVLSIPERKSELTCYPTFSNSTLGGDVKIKNIARMIYKGK